MKKFTRLKHALWIMPLLFLLLWFTYWLANFLTDNFHQVIPGRLYRSAQMQPAMLAHIVHTYHIRSIINLRGVDANSTWHKNELSLAKTAALNYYDLPLLAHQLPSRQALKRLVNILQQAPQPILVHCRSGADRTGLTAAIGVILFTKNNQTYARHQASWRYNALSPTTVGYQMLRNYLTWLQQQQRAFGKTSFLQWINASAKLTPQRGFFI